MKVTEKKGTPKVLDLDALPNVIDIFDDRMKGTEARRIVDKEIERMSKELADEIDAEIIEEMLNGKESND